MQELGSLPKHLIDQFVRIDYLIEGKLSLLD